MIDFEHKISQNNSSNSICLVFHNFIYLLVSNATALQIPVIHRIWLLRSPPEYCKRQITGIGTCWHTCSPWSGLALVHDNNSMLTICLPQDINDRSPCILPNTENVLFRLKCIIQIDLDTVTYGINPYSAGGGG